MEYNLIISTLVLAERRQIRAARVSPPWLGLERGLSVEVFTSDVLEDLIMARKKVPRRSSAKFSRSAKNAKSVKRSAKVSATTMKAANTHRFAGDT